MEDERQYEPFELAAVAEAAPFVAAAAPVVTGASLTIASGSLDGIDTSVHAPVANAVAETAAQAQTQTQTQRPSVPQKKFLADSNVFMDRTAHRALFDSLLAS